MALTQVTAGNRILASDINQFYNILKGVAASGESITLVYNAAASIILQPSSDPAAGTEAIQIKNNAGTVQGSLTYDGKVKAADGTAALPSLRMQSEASGIYLSSAGVLGVSVSGAAANILFAGSAISIGTNPSTAGLLRLQNNAAIASRNNANGGNILLMYGTTADNVAIGDAAVYADFKQAVIALGGGAAPTLGTIGGSGPAATAQNSWMKVFINGTASYLPVWR